MKINWTNEGELSRAIVDYKNGSYEILKNTETEEIVDHFYERSGDTSKQKGEELVKLLKGPTVKPVAKLLGENGNVFNLMGICRRSLQRAGMREESERMIEKIRTSAKSYDEALQIMMEYCEVE